MRLSSASVLVAPATILLLFAGTLIGRDRLGFRDVGHFYTPLYDYVAWRTSSQPIPLWNPLDETGIPLVGETTTAVFYPLRYVLFALPLATETAIAWYVALHLILAAIAAWWAARWSSAGPIAASVAGVVYPLSGSLLFLYTNPPYLVGSAWLPLALAAMVVRRPMSTAARTLIGGVSMSMMILGGDPQTALHAMIVAGLVWLLRQIRRRDQNLPLAALIAAPTLAALLSMPQIAASASWGRLSERTRASATDSWIDPPLTGSRRYEAFQYSLAPWHLLELATPNASGSLLPVNRRISSLVPGDGRMWTPSIYIGLLGIVALLANIGRSRTAGVDPWLAIAGASLALAMGHFGLVWWVQTVTGGMMNVDSAVGGPYWLLYHALPGYDTFRYPAKWLTLFSLAAAIITGLTIERGLSKRIVDRVALPLGIGLLVALALTIIVRLRPTILFDGSAAAIRDEFWGPLDIEGGLIQISRSLIHSAVALLCIVGVVWVAASRRWSPAKIAICLLAITTIDLAIFASALIARVPRRMEQQLVSKLAPPAASSDAHWMRTQSGGGWPAAWKETSDADRLIDVEASGRAAWFGRWHLADRSAVLNNMVSVRSRDVAAFWRAARQLTAELPSQQREEFWFAIRNWLHVDGVLHTSAEAVDVSADGRTARLVAVQRFVDSMDNPLRIHDDWTYSDATEPTGPAFTQRLRQIASLESGSSPLVQAPHGPPPSPGSGDRRSEVRQIASQPDSAAFELSLQSTSLATRPIFQDGHWTSQYAPAASHDWRPLPVHQVDFLKQGVILPAGDWQLRFRYAPWWLPWALATAAVAWIAAITIAARLWRARDHSLADAESSKNAVEDVVGVDRAGHLAE